MTTTSHRFATRQDLVDFLQSTLIPDLKKSEMDGMVASFRKLVRMLKTGKRDEKFITFLVETLIPDLKSSGYEFTANDFEEGVRLLGGPPSPVQTPPVRPRVAAAPAFATLYWKETAIDVAAVAVQLPVACVQIGRKPREVCTTFLGTLDDDAPRDLKPADNETWDFVMGVVAALTHETVLKLKLTQRETMLYVLRVAVLVAEAVRDMPVAGEKLADTTAVGIGECDYCSKIKVVRTDSDGVATCSDCEGGSDV